MCFNAKYAALLAKPEKGEMRVPCWKEFYIKVYHNGEFELMSHYRKYLYYKGNIRENFIWKITTEKIPLIVEKDNTISEGYHAYMNRIFWGKVKNSLINEVDKYIEIYASVRIWLGGDIWINRYAEAVGEYFYLHSTNETDIRKYSNLLRLNELIEILYEKITRNLDEKE